MRDRSHGLSRRGQRRIQVVGGTLLYNLVWVVVVVVGPSGRGGGGLHAEVRDEQLGLPALGFDHGHVGVHGGSDDAPKTCHATESHTGLLGCLSPHHTLLELGQGDVTSANCTPRGGSVSSGLFPVERAGRAGTRLCVPAGAAACVGWWVRGFGSPARSEWW